MAIQINRPRLLLIPAFLGVLAMTFLLVADYSFAQRDRRGGDSPRVSRQQGRIGGDSPRVSRQQGRRDGNSPRVNRQQGRRGGKTDRVIRHREKRRIMSPRVTRHGHVVRKLPRGYTRVWHRKKPYYYNRGIFYSSGPSGFIVVRAPLGSVVVSLPVGYRRVWVSGAWFYSYGGAFYRRAPSGYVVVEPPAEVIVEENVPVLVQPATVVSGQVSVTASILNVRSGPDMSYPLIYQVHSGYILEIHGRSNEWLYVELPNGEFGWVMAEYTYRLKSPGKG